MLSNRMSEMKVTETVLISGMGPAGLLAACEAILSNKRITIITNRPENEQIRSRRVLTEEENLPYLRSLVARMMQAHHTLTPADEAFLNEIDYGLTINIKKLEKFLLRRIQQYRADGYPLRIVDNSEIKSFDFSAGTAGIGAAHSSAIDEYVQFTMLICADGTKRHAVTLCNEHLNKDDKIHFYAVEHPSQREHVSAYLEIRRKNECPIAPVRQASFNKHANTKTTLAVAFNTRHSLFAIKCNVSAELPRALSAESCEVKKVQDTLTYLNAVVDEIFDEKTDIRVTRSKSSPEKDKTKLSFFNIELRYAEDAVFEINGVCIILIGDTQATPNYQIGNGLNDAIVEAMQLGKCMRGECSYHKYRQLCKKLNDQAATETAVFATRPMAEHNLKIKELLILRNQRKISIEQLREYFYQTFPDLPRYEISMFAMLHYRDAANLTFLNIAALHATLEPLLIFKSLDYASGFSKTYLHIMASQAAAPQQSSTSPGQ